MFRYYLLPHSLDIAIYIFMHKNTGWVNLCNIMLVFSDLLVWSELNCAGHLSIGLFTLPPAAFVTCYYQLVRINQRGVINIMSSMQGWHGAVAADQYNFQHPIGHQVTFK